MTHKSLWIRTGIFFVIILLAALLTPGKRVSAASKYAVTIDLSKGSDAVYVGQDITRVLQEALDKAAKKGTPEKPGLVKVPKGLYYISNSLVIRSNTVLYLQKYTIIRKKPKEFFSKMIRVPDPAPDTPGGYDAYSNITIYGGIWDNNYCFTSCEGRGTSGSLFFFAHTDGLKIKNAEIRNVYGTHAIELGGVRNCLITDCRIHGFKADSNSISKEAIQIDVCHDNNILPSGAPFDDTPCTGITVSNCKIYDYPRAVGSHIAVNGVYHRDIVIEDNEFCDIKNAAVYGYNYIGLTVTGNTMQNVGAGVIMRNCALEGTDTFYSRLHGIPRTNATKGDYGILIENNIIETSDRTKDIDLSDPDSMDTGTKAKGILIYGEETRPIRNVTVSMNTITSSNCGIVLYYVENSSVVSNKVKRTEGAVPVSDTSYVEEGIRLNTCKGVTIKKNTVSSGAGDCFENGIGLRYGSDNSLEGNRISNAAKNGIYICGDSVTGNSNVIKAAGSNGIAVSQSGKLTLTMGDKVINSFGNGICAAGSSVIEITGISVIGSGASGAALGTGATAIFKNVGIQSNGEYGILLGKDTPVTVSGNSVIDKNVLGGIFPKNSPYSIQGKCRVQE